MLTIHVAAGGASPTFAPSKYPSAKRVAFQILFMKFLLPSSFFGESGMRFACGE